MLIKQRPTLPIERTFATRHSTSAAIVRPFVSTMFSSLQPPPCVPMAHTQRASLTFEDGLLLVDILSPRVWKALTARRSPCQQSMLGCSHLSTQ